MLKTKLYAYQKVGVDFMLSKEKCLNLDDCGLGKTIQTLAYIDELNKDTLTKVIVVVKPNNLPQWEQEIHKLSDLSVMQIKGNKKQRVNQYKKFITGDKKILLLNYNKIIYDFDEILGLQEACSTIVFDEAFSLKNPTGETHLRFFELTKTFDRVVMLTATPVGSTLYDFYNIMKVMHIFLPSEEDFIEQYVVAERIFVNMGGFYVPRERYTGSKNIDDFKETFGHLFIRRENKESFTFGINFKNYPLELSRNQKIMCNNLKEAFNTQTPENPIPAVKVYSQFAQIADAPCLLDSDAEVYSPKVKEFLKIVRGTQEQFVVYAKYLKFHSLLGDILAEQGITFEYYSGAFSEEEKEQAKKKFLDGDAQVLLITDAGKEGLNLQVAHKLIFLDIPNSPADCIQLIGRVYRNGQRNNVEIYFLYMQDSLEEDRFSRIRSIQEDVDALFNQDKSEIFAGAKSEVNIKSFLKRDYRVA